MSQEKGASARVADILGMQNAHTLLRALDDDGEAAQVARETIRSSDEITQLKFALIEMCHAVDRAEELRARDRAELEALAKEHSEVMSGKSTSCRFLADMETRLLRYLVAAFVIPLLLWGVIKFLDWRIESRSQKGGVETHDARTETGSP